MGILGIPYRAIYEGKNFRSGLTDVVAAVLRPDNVPLGPFPMPELGSPFLGRYAFNLSTSPLSPEGEYLIMILSPTENIQTTLKVPVYKRQTVYSNRISTAFNDVTGMQEVLAWAEKDGQTVNGSNCTVTVKDAAGATVWAATQASPNADGVFKFTNAITPVTNSNYYIVVVITVDAALRTSQQPFFTAG